MYKYDDEVQALIIMYKAAVVVGQKAVLPVANTAIHASIEAVKQMSSAGVDTVSKMLHEGETTLKNLSTKESVKFLDITNTELEPYRNELKARGVDFNIENVGYDNKFRIWYAAKDIEQIKAAVIDAGEKYLNQNEKTPNSIQKEVETLTKEVTAPTSEQLKTIEEMKLSGRMDLNIESKNGLDAHKEIEKVLLRESGGKELGAKFASTSEAIAFNQGKTVEKLTTKSEEALSKVTQSSVRAIEQSLER